MPSFRCTYCSLAILLFINTQCFANEETLNHQHIVNINSTLTLSQLIDKTLENFPDHLLNASLKQEADALQRRGESFLAGAPRIAMRYQDDVPFDDIGSREIEAELELPLWNWGQRSAGQNLAKQAKNAAEKQSAQLKLNIAKLVRNSLWNMALEKIRYTHAKSILNISQKQLNKIKRRVELGDLARSDLLLAKSDYLQKKSLFIQAEAEMMHSRQNYISLTKTTDIPADYVEQQSSFTKITDRHPSLSVINAIIKRKQAEVDWVKSVGSGQSSFIVGGKSEKGHENDDDIESLAVEISIPFGGSAHLAPDIAAANIELTEALTLRAHLFRELERKLHDAQYALEVSQLELTMSNELKEIAQSHLKMTQLSFSEGEINLMDLLKIQARSYHAIRKAEENKTMLQKNIALYNQAVGVQP